MMNTLFGDFSKWPFLVLATLHFVIISKPVDRFWYFCIILMRNQCYVLCYKSQNSRKYPCDSFREVGSHEVHTLVHICFLPSTLIWKNQFVRLPPGRKMWTFGWHYIILFCVWIIVSFSKILVFGWLFSILHLYRYYFAISKLKSKILSTLMLSSMPNSIKHSDNLNR